MSTVRSSPIKGSPHACVIETYYHESAKKWVVAATSPFVYRNPIYLYDDKHKALIEHDKYVEKLEAHYASDAFLIHSPYAIIKRCKERARAAGKPLRKLELWD